MNDVEKLKFLGINVVTAGHAHVTENELRKERQIEANEKKDGSPSGQHLRVHSTGDLREPVMDAAEISHDRAPDHDVVEMRDDEVGLGHVDIDRKGSEHQAGHTADGEERDKTESVKKGRVEGDVALVERGRPIEDLDRGGDGDEKA